MKTLLKSCFFIVLFVLVGCSNQSGWKRLAEHEIDQKSYAIGYTTTAQTYLDRVNETYDIEGFGRGAKDWLDDKVNLPVEQIRSSLLNRILDHPIYAYYSGVLFAADLQNNFKRLSTHCWSIIQSPSLVQGIFDAMADLKKKKVRDDNYLSKGTEQILHQCVEQMEKEQPSDKKPAK